MKSLKSFIFGAKAVPYIDVISEETREGLQKAFIPKFLYKPPFGFPRFANIDYVRYLAKTPYVEMCIDTILKEIAAIEWDIVPNPEIPERIADELYYEEDGSFKQEVEAEINHIRSFLENPNTNKESFEDIFVKMAYRDVLEVNTGVINKVYNFKKQMVELVARDGATFTKNPDIHGMMTNREDILIPKKIVENPGEAVNPFMHISQGLAREKAAYFQYGWISGPVPVPFGKKEIIWLQNMRRSDDIYAYSPVQLLAKALQMMIYHIESDLEYYNDNNVPKGIIGIDASDADEIKAFKQQWHDAIRTKDEFGNWKKLQHKVPILNYIPKFERIEFSSEEIQLIEKQKWYSKMVWASFGVTATELGYTEDGQGVSNQIVQSKVFKKKAINPALRMLGSHINREVITEFEYGVDVPTGKTTLPMPKYVFKFNTFDIDEEKSKAELHKVWIETGRKTINEIRISEGETPVEWGDEAPRNVMSNGGNSFFMGNSDGNSKKESFTEKEETAEDVEQNDDVPQPKEMNENQDRNEKRVSNQKSKKKSDTDLGAELVSFLKDKEREIKKYLEKEKGSDVLKQIKSDLDGLEVTENDLSNIEVKSVDDLIKALKSILDFSAFRQLAYNSIRNDFLKGAYDSEEEINEKKPYNYIPDRDAIDYIGRYTFENVKGMSDDIANDLRVQLQIGFMNGEGVTKLKSRVQDVFNVSTNRAKTIARTESNRAFQFGKLSAYKESGMKARKWIMITDDNRTSPISLAADKKYGSEDKAISIEENFKFSAKVGKKTVIIDQPAPPFHPNERDDMIITPIID